jgi:hypothetical protein
MREHMISVILEHWYYTQEELDVMSDVKISDIYECLLDWLEA